MHLKGFLLALGLIFVVLRKDVSATCFKLRSALDHDNKIHFFFSVAAVTFNATTRREMTSAPIARLFPKLDWPYFHAAYRPASDPESIIVIYKNKYAQYKNGARVKGPSPLSEVFPDNAYFSNGLDAAALFLGEEYFFRGCLLGIKRSNGNFSVYHLRRLGLPCFMDAAWVDNHGSLVMTKSVLFWRMSSSRKLSTRPTCFAKYFSTSFPMCRCTTQIKRQ